jgi:hypothetical protein
LKRALTLLATTTLVACAVPGPSSVRVGDDQAQVRARLGAPGAERKLTGGGLAWYYMTGPSGFETWRVVFGGAGAVTEYAQVLTAANFVWMRESATRDQVLDRVGPPMERMSFARSATDVWTYRWLDGTFEMIAEPVFDAQTGVVKYVGIFRDPAYSSPPAGFK